jgi:beta-glucosidase
MISCRGWHLCRDATHSTSLAQGLDQEMPGSSFMGNDKISSLLSQGSITEEMIDDSVLRMLLPMCAS